MKTSLDFEAPSDFSVGTIRITGVGETIADWVATPDKRMLQQKDLKPGVYLAEVGPAGVAPQSVMFEVREGQANTVVLPSFSALRSAGSNVSFFDTASQQAVFVPPSSMDVGAYVPPAAVSERMTTASGIENHLVSEPLRQIQISTARRDLSLGLSEEQSGLETFNMFLGQARTELLAGRLAIELPAYPERNAWAGHRVRLSLAIEKARIERCLLPLYRGGTRIAVVASPFSVADLELSVLPIDSKQRALVRALEAGTSSEAKAVRDYVLGQRDPTTLLADDADPWVALVVGLLSIRFSDVFPPIGQAWTDQLAKRASWAFDAHVIRAKQALSAAVATPEAQEQAIARAVGCLADAQVAGSPYYRNANDLFAETESEIADYLEGDGARDDSTATRFQKIHRRWHRELPLVRCAGSTFTWLARDQDALKDRGVLVPNRNPSGRLSSEDTKVIFAGQVGGGQISVTGGEPGGEAPPGIIESEFSSRFAHEGATSESDYAQMPAFARPPGPSNDPNKGRFGGEASCSGYSLTAGFEPAKRPGWTTIVLTVVADPSQTVAIGDIALFVLHPTFLQPPLKVAFRGNRARLALQAWGGFTVGVWIPRAGVELECDLSQVDDAPENIMRR